MKRNRWGLVRWVLCAAMLLAGMAGQPAMAEPLEDFVVELFGHYQQEAAQASGLYIEQVDGYRSYKIDPGPSFMEAVRGELSGDGLTFFDE